MKITKKHIKKNSIILGAVGALALLFGQSIQEATAYSSKPPEGRTNSPKDGVSCMDGCHVGTEIPLNSGITTTVPPEGYTPGETYDITVGDGLGQVGVSKYGFEFSPQNDAGDLLGTLTAGTNSVVTGSKKYIGHKGALSGSDPSWTFKWTAPTAGTGEVNFYAAVVAANGNGTFTGDVVLTTNSKVAEAQASSSTEVSAAGVMASVTPDGNLSLKIESATTSTFQLNVYGVGGNLAMSGSLNVSQGSNLLTIPINSGMKSGVYVVDLSNGSERLQTKIIL